MVVRAGGERNSHFPPPALTFLAGIDSSNKERLSASSFKLLPVYHTQYCLSKLISYLTNANADTLRSDVDLSSKTFCVVLPEKVTLWQIWQVQLQ